MEIINTYPHLINLLDEMQGQFNFELWKKYADGISKDLADMLLEDAKDYDFSKEILPILQLAINSRPAIDELHNTFLSLTDGINDRFRYFFQTELEVAIVLYMGLCNGAGWATKLDGRQAVLLGIEKIIELNWHDKKTMSGLIYHELGHILHFEKINGDYTPKNQREKSLWQLYCEGIAMYCELLLGGSLQSYHQDKNGWLDWCEAHKLDILLEYKRRLAADESTQDFFGDGAKWRDFSDLGYYLGCQFVQSLVPRYSLQELLTFNLQQIETEFENWRF